MEFLARHLRTFFLPVLFLVALFLYAAPVIGLPQKYVSPDETANAFFIRRFATTLRLTVSSPLNSLTEPVVVPRSVVAAHGRLAPVSFYGMLILFGALARVCGVWIIPFLTPLFSATAVVVFALLMRRLLTRRQADVAALLLAVHPVFWYFSGRPLMQNALFTDLSIFAAYGVVRLWRAPGLLSAAVTAVATGIAIFVRASEMLWLLPVLAITLFVIRRQAGRYGLITAAGIIFFLALFFMSNRVLYGGFFSIGYSPSSVDASSVTALSQSLLAKFFRFVMPFGVHWEQIGSAVLNYFLLLYPGFALFWLIGYARQLRQFVKGQCQKPMRLYLVLYTLSTLWLFLYYGSWKIREFGDPTEILIASSYLRYWLVPFVFGIPFVLAGIQWWLQHFGRAVWQKTLAASTVGLLLFFSFFTAWTDPLHGLLHVRSDIRQSAALSSQMLAATEEDAVILSGSSDKVFFPERSVVYALQESDGSRNATLRALTNVAPVYLFVSPLDAKQVALRSWLQMRQYRLIPVVPSIAEGSLYRVVALDSNVKAAVQ